MMNTIEEHKLAFMNFTSGLLGGGGAQIDIKPPSRVLLVDDEPRMLSSLGELLKTGGYQLATAVSGFEAIDHLGKGKFDLVILDMSLPDISGHEVMDFIISSNVDTDVIVVSGNNDIDSAIGALKRGAFDYLRKPYAREELLKAVGNVLKQRALKADNQRFAWQLESSERVYRYFVENSPDIIYTLNNEGMFTFVNNRVEQLLGLSREELIGKHYSSLVHDEDNELARYVFIERRVDERASRNVELRLRSHKGYCESRTFENSLLTISFSSMGMYALNQNENNPEFLGTYGVARDITERKRAEELIAYHAYHDILTDLPNRVLFKDRLGLSIIQSQRNETKLAVMFIDLDRFKLVNDSMGHVRGDELLQQVAVRLKECLRRSDTLARLGGDEFILSIPDLRDRQDVAEIAEKFLDCLQLPFFLGSTEVRISASIGIAMYPDDGSSIEELVRHADLAMYYVKAQGKNGHSFYDGSMVDASHQKLVVEQDLHRALERGELEMYYQPQVDVSTGRIVAAEALMRWNHPERGLLTPSEFLPFAEENGLMIPISDWMLESICNDLIEWNTALNEPVRVALNLSPQYLERGKFVEKLTSALKRHNISPQQMEIEVTENTFIRNPDHAIEQFNRLCQLGVSIAIDDFGTGYSSLAYLQRFSIHTLKIDQSFVKEIHWESAHSPIILAIISIAKGLGLNVVAEGVETEIQSRYLERAGCNIMQGYLYHRPIPKTKLIQKLVELESEQQEKSFEQAGAK
jgi:diguanylate cyclase (GGDEF)-like protein/PAS domain S-box-containing protein